jgi:long-chain acyl-CoA synthetase
MSKLYSAPEVASQLAIELDTLYRYARVGDLRGLKIGKLWRFTEADVQEFIHSRRYLVYPKSNCSMLLSQILREIAQRPREQGSITCRTTRISYAEIDFLSDRLAAALVRRGIGPGSRVVMVLPNSVEFVIACFAIWKVRAIVVPEDTTIRPNNFRHILEETQPAAVIVDSNLAVQLEGMHGALDCVKVIFLKDCAFALSTLAGIAVESLDAVLQCGARATALPAGARPDEVVSITYTSGSSGAPKGVMHTHESWLAGAAFTRDYLEISAKDKIVVPLPLHHAYAFRQILAYLLTGGSVVIAADIYSALRLITEERPTALLLVPAACNILIDHFASVLRKADSILRYVEIGSGAMTPEGLNSLKGLLPDVQLYLSYGLTEARVGFLKPGPDGLLNKIASYSPGLQLQVVDSQDQPVAQGQTGEIVLRGRGLMKGYWGDPPAAQERLRSRGLRTGDMGRVECGGEVALLGRLDDVLKVAGHKISPLEVERTLNRHPAVRESVVAGLPDPGGIMEQELHAFVVLRTDAASSASELLAYCRQSLEPHKVPARIHLLASLPKSPLGKVQRQLLIPEHSTNFGPSEGNCHAGSH